MKPKQPDGQGAGTRRDPVRASLERFRTSVRRRAFTQVTDVFFRSLSRAAKSLMPIADEDRHQVEIIRDLAYLPSGAAHHRLDVYRPIARTGPHPIVFYVHGGGFSLLSKDTHWVMGMMFARMGYLVFNISYRLAPRHPFPAAISDTLAAYEWMVHHAADYGGDLARVAVAGESAGANLVTSLSVATSYPQPEPWARRVYDLGVAPRVAVPFCGIFQVSDVERFWRRRRLPKVIQQALGDVAAAYLRDHDPTASSLDLADPVVLLERGERPVRPLPAFFIPVGTRDPLLDDTRRLKRALDGVGAVSRAEYYPGEIHAFHAMVFRQRARQCWNDTFGFLDQHLRAQGARPRSRDAA